MIKSNYAYGIYQVGTQTFLNKSDALYYASRTGENVTWDFHDAVYKKANWTQRPPGTLLDLYRLRAQQIRDNYDYVIVHFSGGADSWTVLDSFLSNGIHVDEISTRWAMDERKYKSANNTDFREVNLCSEYEFAAEPVLKQIEKSHPQTYIYVDDYSDAYQRELTEADLKHGGHYIGLGTFHRFARKSPKELQAVKQGLKIGVVYGFDKIQCLAKDGKFYAYFTDRFGGADLDPDRSVEAFYWNPTFPEIPILQAHCLKDWYTKYPFNGRIKDTYVPVCYPRYNNNTFQVMKPAGSEVWASELWLHKYNPRYIDVWKWHNQQYVDSIDQRFLQMFGNKIRLGYKSIVSPMYYIGEFAAEINSKFEH